VRITAVAPGRVNLIGEHTDTTGGLVLPLATDLATTVTGIRGGDEVRLTSDDVEGAAVVPIDVEDPATVEPGWARYVAGVVAEVRPGTGFVGTVTTTLPLGAGLSSSAALEVAVALAIGLEGTDLEVAQLAQRAERRASGVPCGILDQLASTSGRAGHALLIDCHELSIQPVELPPDVEVRVVHSGQVRALTDGRYAQRHQALNRAEAELGPLRLVTDTGPLEGLGDPEVRRRARHVITENARVKVVVEALHRGDLGLVGRAMADSHASLRDDFEVSTPLVDALVERLTATEGVHGARLTGAGFGGCVVALTVPGALSEGWKVTASTGAHLVR